jgi:peptidyl-prolyl cis-trans isomerase C
MKLCVALLISAAIALGVSANAAEKKIETTEAKKADAPKTEAAAPAEVKPAPAEPNKPAPKPVDPNATVVTVNGKVFKEKDFTPEINKQIDAQAKRMAGMGWPMNDETKAMMAEQMRDQVVDMTIEKELLNEQLKAKKIDVNDAQINARFDDMVKESGQKIEEIEAILAQRGSTISDFKEQAVRPQLSIEKLYEADASYKAVTEADANAFYSQNKTRFEKPEQVRASHILIMTKDKDEAGKAEAKKKIEDLLKQARGGADFAELARKHSEDPGSKDKGGEYTFPKGQMVPEFEQAAFALEPNKISDVVETQYGYHIIKLSEKLPAKTETFDEAKAKIINGLKGQNTGEFFNKFRQEMKTNAKIEWSPTEKADREQRSKDKQEAMAAQQMQRQMQQQQQQPKEATPVPPQPKPEEK